MPENPSFFEVLIAVDFKKLLRFPRAFSRKHGPNPGTKTKLRSPSGATWKVKVEKMEYGTLCFTKGWQNFAEDAVLQLREVVFFTQVAPSEFDVSIYKTNFCERQIPHHSHASMNNPHARKAKNVGKRNHPGTTTFHLERAALALTLSTSKFISRIINNLDCKFVVAGKLEGESHVRMEFVRGKGSGEGERVVLDNSHGRTDLANGWSKFRIENELISVWQNIFFRVDGSSRHQGHPS